MVVLVRALVLLLVMSRDYASIGIGLSIREILH
jgi:hypothetical protein